MRLLIRGVRRHGETPFAILRFDLLRARRLFAGPPLASISVPCVFLRVASLALSWRMSCALIQFGYHVTPAVLGAYHQRRSFPLPLSADALAWRR
jgi:hypothetical protein